MKLFSLVITCVFFLVSSSFAQTILSNNDVATSSTLDYDLDGIELWTIPQNEQAQALEAFTNKCLTHIPTSFEDRLNVLRVDLEDFSYSTTVITKRHSGLGIQKLCRANVKILTPKKYTFKFDYSKIISKNPFETCKEMVADLDTKVEELSLFDRRAYFQMKVLRNDDLIFEKCQVLAIKLNTK